MPRWAEVQPLAWCGPLLGSPGSGGDWLWAGAGGDKLSHTVTHCTEALPYHHTAGAGLLGMEARGAGGQDSSLLSLSRAEGVCSPSDSLQVTVQVPAATPGGTEGRAHMDQRVPHYRVSVWERG